MVWWYVVWVYLYNKNWIAYYVVNVYVNEGEKERYNGVIAPITVDSQKQQLQGIVEKRTCNLPQIDMSGQLDIMPSCRCTLQDQTNLNFNTDTSYFTSLQSTL